MDFDILTSNQQSDSLIQKDNDPATYNMIAAKLCDKRTLLEKNLENKELEQSVREDTAFDLIQIKKDMTIFGVSEIDYQAYMANKEKVAEQETMKETTGEPLQEISKSGALLVEPD